MGSTSSISISYIVINIIYRYRYHISINIVLHFSFLPHDMTDIKAVHTCMKNPRGGGPKFSKTTIANIIRQKFNQPSSTFTRKNQGEGSPRFSPGSKEFY